MRGDVDAAFEQLFQRGWVHEMPFESRYAEIAARFANIRLRNESAQVICSTHRETIVVSSAVRDALKAAGVISNEEYEIESFQPLHLTEAHRRQVRKYSPGDVIVFRKKTRHFDRGTVLRVSGVAEGSLYVITPDGECKSIKPRSIGKYVSVFKSVSIFVSKGDELVFHQNGISFNGRPFRAGDRAKVDRVEHGAIHFTDGKIIRANYGFWALSYATTSQQAQGDTVDHVFIAIDEISAYCATTLETFYVAVSRGRKSCEIFTDDKEALFDAIHRRSERLSIFELCGSCAANEDT